MECSKHGLTAFAFVKKEKRYRCRKCSVDANHKRRKEMKKLLIEEAGGKCLDCGGVFPPYVFDFDHRDPSQKKFNVSGHKRAAALNKLREEAAKCDLVCSNCHRIRTHKQRCRGCDECQ